MAKKPKQRRLMYRTTQIDVERGEQYRLTGGKTTIYVWRNGRGLYVSGDPVKKN